MVNWEKRSSPSALAYSAFAVANAFIEKAQQGFISTLSPMKLQRLMYLAQAWHMKYREGNSLFDDNFVRWKNGPVIPSLFYKVQAYRDQCINQRVPTIGVGSEDGWIVINIPTVPHDDADAWGLVDAIVGKYGRLTPIELAQLTAQSGSAWAAGGALGTVILAREIVADFHVVRERCC